MSVTLADLDRAIDKAHNRGLTVWSIRMDDALFNDLFKDYEGGWARILEQGGIVHAGIPVTPDADAPPGTFYLSTRSTPKEKALFDMHGHATGPTTTPVFDGPDDAAVEHAWIYAGGELRIRAFDDTNEAFHVGFRAGAVWQHNKDIEP